MFHWLSGGCAATRFRHPAPHPPIGAVQTGAVHGVLAAFLLVLLTVARASFGHAQVPYGEYENWTGSPATYENPMEWSSLNEVHHALGYPEMTLTKSADALEGNYAMELHTRRLCYMDSLVCYLVPGVSVIGELIINPSDLSIFTPGVPFAERPETLNGYFKYFPVEDDSARIIVELSRAVPGGEREVVGRGEWAYGDLMPQYNFFNIPIAYSSSANPDKLRIFVYSGVRNQEHPDPYPIGSRLLVDWVKMGPNVVEPPVGLSGPAPEAGLRIYPQPARTGHYLEAPQSGQQLTLECWDLQGRLVARQAHQSAPIAQWVDWSGVAAGQYRLVLRSPVGEIMGTAPLILQR